MSASDLGDNMPSRFRGLLILTGGLGARVLLIALKPPRRSAAEWPPLRLLSQSLSSDFCRKGRMREELLPPRPALVQLEGSLAASWAGLARADSVAAGFDGWESAACRRAEEVKARWEGLEDAVAHLADTDGVRRAAKGEDGDRSKASAAFRSSIVDLHIISIIVKSVHRRLRHTN